MSESYAHFMRSIKKAAQKIFDFFPSYSYVAHDAALSIKNAAI